MFQLMWGMVQYLFQADDASVDTEALSREELGRIVGSRWTGKKTEEQAGEADPVKDDGHENYDETPKDEDDEEFKGYDSEEDDHSSYDDDTDDQIEDFKDEDHGDSTSSYNYDADDDLDLSGI